MNETYRYYTNKELKAYFYISLNKDKYKNACCIWCNFTCTNEEALMSITWLKSRVVMDLFFKKSDLDFLKEDYINKIGTITYDTDQVTLWQETPDMALVKF